METLGQRITRVRKWRAKTQAEVAKEAKVSLLTYGRIEGGKVLSPQPKTLRAIAETLGTTPEWLMDPRNENGLPS